MSMMAVLTARQWAVEGANDQRQLLLQQLREVGCFLPVKSFLRKHGQELFCPETHDVGPSEKLTLLLLASLEDPPIQHPLDEEVRLLRAQLRAVCEHELGQSIECIDGIRHI
jgi:hypothetical protein